MNILLIGGTGNISTGIINALQARFGDKAHITVFNRNKTQDRLPPNITRLHGDRNDFPAFANQFANATYDAVIDMICFTPQQAQSLLQTFSGKTPHLLFCSTVCVYGNTQSIIPTTEATTPQPHSTYGQNKLACENLLLQAAREGAFTKSGGVTILRPSHTFGPGFTFNGQTGAGSTTFIDRIQRNLPLIVSGDGHGLWQITASDNVGLAFAHALHKPHTLNETYNVVAHTTRTWDQVVQEVATALNAPPPKIIHLPSDLLVSLDPDRYRGLNEIFRYHGVYSNAKITRDIPEYQEQTPFQSALQQTVQWMQSQSKIKPAESDPFETKLIELYESFAASTKKSLTPAPS